MDFWNHTWPLVKCCLLSDQKNLNHSNLMATKLRPPTGCLCTGLGVLVWGAPPAGRVLLSEGRKLHIARYTACMHGLQPPLLRSIIRLISSSSGSLAEAMAMRPALQAGVVTPLSLLIFVVIKVVGVLKAVGDVLNVLIKSGSPVWRLSITALFKKSFGAHLYVQYNIPNTLCKTIFCTVHIYCIL